LLEIDAVRVDPLRTIYSRPLPDSELPATKVVEPPLDDRVMNSMPPPGLISRMTSAEPAVSDCRIITPAFALASVFCSAVTRAMIDRKSVVEGKTRGTGGARPQRAE